MNPWLTALCVVLVINAAVVALGLKLASNRRAPGRSCPRTPDGTCPPIPFPAGDSNTEL